MENFKEILEEAILKKVIGEQLKNDKSQIPQEIVSTDAPSKAHIHPEIISGVSQKIIDNGLEINNEDIRKLFQEELFQRLKEKKDSISDDHNINKANKDISSGFPIFKNPYNVSRRPVSSNYDEKLNELGQSSKLDSDSNSLKEKVDLTLDNFIKNVAWRVKEINHSYESHSENIKGNYRILPHQEIKSIDKESNININPYQYKILR